MYEHFLSHLYFCSSRQYLIGTLFLLRVQHHAGPGDNKEKHDPPRITHCLMSSLISWILPKTELCGSSPSPSPCHQTCSFPEFSQFQFTVAKLRVTVGLIGGRVKKKPNSNLCILTPYPADEQILTLVLNVSQTHPYPLHPISTYRPTAPLPWVTNWPPYLSLLPPILTPNHYSECSP